MQLPAPTSSTLSNGLTLILNERKELPIVAANLVFKTGSDGNPLEKPGLANFVAAMLDEGTTTRNAPQIADEVAKLGASLNTASSMDATTVSGRSLAKNFAATVNLMADVVLQPSFPAEEIERQRASRLGQLVQQRDNPGQVAAQVTAAALFGDRHPYGFTEIGTEASVKALGRDDMVAFWKQNFVPGNAALVVAGDISMPELQALAEKAFGGWQRGTPARPALGSPTTTKAKIVVVDKPGSEQTQVRVATIGAPRSSPDFRPMQVMNMALGGLFSSRINMNLREAHGYTYGASSQFVFRRSAGPFQVASGVRTDVTAPAVTEIFKEIRGMAEKPMTEEELRSAKTSMINSLPGAFETTFDAVGNFSNVYLYDLGLDYYTKYRERGERGDVGAGARDGEEVPRRGPPGGHCRGRPREDRTRVAEAQAWMRSSDGTPTAARRLKQVAGARETRALASTAEPGSSCIIRTGFVGYASRHLGLPRTAGSIVDLIGNTPMVRLSSFEAGLRNVELYAKAEWKNPGGSVKDRAAARMMADGERSGALTRGKIILDATSGNTGIAYAMIAAARGLPCAAVRSGERDAGAEADSSGVRGGDRLHRSDGRVRRRDPPRQGDVRREP